MSAPKPTRPAARALDELARRYDGVDTHGASRQVRELLALQRIGLAVGRHMNPRRICAAAVDALQSLLRYRRSLIAVVDPESGEIDVLAHAGTDVEESRAERARIATLIRDNPDRGVIRWVIDNARTLRVDDTVLDERYVVGQSEMRSELCVPVTFADRVLGAVNIETDAPNAFDEHDESLLAVVATQVAAALEKARLFADARHELTRRRRAETSLAASERRYRALVENADEGILVVGEGRIRFGNARAAGLLDRSAKRLVGKRFAKLITKEDRARVDRAVESALLRRDAMRAPGVAIPGPAQRRVNLSVSPIEWNSAPAVLCFLTDVTEAFTLTERLRHQASHDALTGLVNRREFEGRLGTALRSARSSGYRHVMCYMDLDQFKIVNDSGGHAAGDELLRQLSATIRGAIRDRDTLARLGGDEFGLLLEHCDLDQAMRVAGGIERAVREFRFEWEGKEHVIGASIGIVAIRPDHESEYEILRAADAACYVAKDEGRGRIRVYREDDATVAQRRTEMRWVMRMRRALDANELELHCQPIAPLQAREEGERWEVLVRLREPSGELVEPSRFLPSVERYDLARRLDGWVIERTLRWLGDNPRRLGRMALCSINLSGQSIGDTALRDTIASAIVRYRIPPRKICFEVTETAAIRTIEASKVFVRDLRQLGCRFALDDFGAGLSSFRYLRELPIDILKIDGSFVRDLSSDAPNAAIVSAIHALGRTFGMLTVGEFATERSTIEALREIGIDYAQGYAIGEPVPLAGLADDAVEDEGAGTLNPP